jgi:hypothetical protein
MDLSLNIPKEFGYEFQFNFERSLNDFQRTLNEAKVSMQKKIETEGIFIPREIEGNSLFIIFILAGYSFFLKTKNASKSACGNEGISGELFGHGMKDYYNYYIKI